VRPLWAAAVQVLSPAGHGKSSLLKAIAGRIPPSDLDGKIWYGGKLGNEVNLDRLVMFVDQSDVHFPLLTVTETLQFSLECTNRLVSEAHVRGSACVDVAVVPVPASSMPLTA
jgi:ABC-type multidrug transport system ATPase subunit